MRERARADDGSGLLGVGLSICFAAVLESVAVAQGVTGDGKHRRRGTQKGQLMFHMGYGILWAPVPAPIVDLPLEGWRRDSGKVDDSLIQREARPGP